MMSTCKSSMETILTVSTVYSSFLPFTLYFYYSVIESPLVNALYCVYAPHYFRFINKAMSQHCLFTRSFSLSSFTTIFISFFCFLFSTSLLVRLLVRESRQPLSLNRSLVHEPCSQHSTFKIGNENVWIILCFQKFLFVFLEKNHQFVLPLANQYQMHILFWDLHCYLLFVHPLFLKYQ